jgi:hypothetical protein
MSDTPRTDALIYRKTTIEMQRHELLDLALALERELVAARAEIVLLTKRKNEFSNGWDAALEQRDLAVEALRLCNVDQFTTAAELAEANARLDWLDTVECRIYRRGYGEYWHYYGAGFPKIREIIDAAMKEGK